ncbi:MAG: ABC transporter permease [Clostridiales bacterium]|nr:ABC transporter permease [Clostridiales bacterium]
MPDERSALALKSALREQRMLVLRSALDKRMAVAGFAIMTVIVLLAVLAPVLAPAGPYEINPLDRLLPPSSKHWFGTDALGRDLLSRTLYGLRISLAVGGSTALASSALGLLLGLLSGYFSFAENIIMRICEGMMAIPPMLLAIALVAALGSTSFNVFLSLSVAYMPLVARVARSSTLSVREQTYIEAIKSQGASWARVLFGHIAPNVMSPIIVQTTYIFASAIIIEAALSFLGAGVPPPAPSLGNVLYDAKSVIFSAWWTTVLPGIVMMLTVLGLNILGDGIRDVMDPAG